MPDTTKGHRSELNKVVDEEWARFKGSLNGEFDQEAIEELSTSMRQRRWQAVSKVADLAKNVEGSETPEYTASYLELKQSSSPYFWIQGEVNSAKGGENFDRKWIFRALRPDYRSTQGTQGRVSSFSPGIPSQRSIPRSFRPSPAVGSSSSFTPHLHPRRFALHRFQRQGASAAEFVAETKEALGTVINTVKDLLNENHKIPSNMVEDWTSQCSNQIDSIARGIDSSNLTRHEGEKRGFFYSSIKVRREDPSTWLDITFRGGIAKESDPSVPVRWTPGFRVKVMSELPLSEEEWRDMEATGIPTSDE